MKIFYNNITRVQTGAMFSVQVRSSLKKGFSLLNMFYGDVRNYKLLQFKSQFYSFHLEN